MATILAIDDDVAIRTLIPLLLASTGHKVLTAHNGAEGWEVLMQCRDDIAVILLDLDMPVMNGIEFLTRLSQDATLKNLPVIVQSAYDEQPQIAEVLREGIVAYLAKPYSQRTLLEHVTSALQDVPV